MNQSATTQRLLKLYDNAPERTRLAGRSWYTEAAGVVADISESTALTPAQVCGAFSALSPRVHYVRNVRLTRTLCRMWHDVQDLGVDLLPRAEDTARALGCMSSPMREAYAALKSEHTPRGPKTGAFYRAILGDDSALVLDVWALRACGLERLPRVGERRTITASYRSAAARRGETVRDFQAIVWCAIRGRVN